MAIWDSAMVGHPEDPETFEFRSTRLNDGALRRVRAFVIYDSRWPLRRRLIARIGTALLRKAVEGENLG